MPPRPLIPADELYARLELPADASFEAVEIAWRALLKRHHPDVAGGDAAANDRAKRINVAHDWLSDSQLRARYDHERGRTGRAGGPATRMTRSGSAGRWTHPSETSTGPAPERRSGRRPPANVDEALDRHLDRVERLTPDEIDRLS